MRVRFGLAGLGVHGARYAAHLLGGEVDGASLVAVSRHDERRGRDFAKRHGLKFTPEPLALATMDGVDAVIAVLPPDLHPPLALACLAAGRPSLVEKPVAADAAGARRVLREAERTGIPLMVAQTLRFDPLLVRLRDEAARLGPPRLIAINQRFEPFHRPWIDTPGPGGILLNTGVHGFDLLRFLSGAEPSWVAAEVDRAVTRDTEDQFAAIVRLEPGAVLATVDNTRATAGRSGRVEVAAERAQLAGDHIHRWLRRLEGRSSVELGPVEPVPTVREVLRHFVDCLRRERPPAVTAADGLAAVEMIEAAKRSAETGRRIALDEVRAT